MGRIKTGSGTRIELSPGTSVQASPCIRCYFLTRTDCPRQDEQDRYGDPVKPFAEGCLHWKPYQAEKPKENGYINCRVIKD